MSLLRVTLGLAITFIAIAIRPAYAQETSGFLQVKENRFVDALGRQVLLHGMSIINKNREEGYRSWQGPDDFARMRNWGMNCVRLGILWDGLEPAPGVFDAAYLEQVDQRIAWAEAAGLYVFLDMHQDLYSWRYSDGAPDWATLTDGLPHAAPGGVWSDAYLTSPAVQRAFDNFWANAPCADGVGVQDHFARAWAHVAARYAENPTIIGYDLFNEPNIGSGNLQAQAAMAQAVAQALSERKGEPAPSPEALGAMWLDPKKRGALVELLGDIDIYTALVDAGGPVFAAFERDKLMPMFQRAAKAIRAVDNHHILFLETSMSANMGIPTGVVPLRRADETRDPQQAFAPHGYDIVVDTPQLLHGNNSRVQLIFQRHGETAQRLAMPMLVGEWGAFGNAGPGIMPAARFLVRQFEILRCSDTYWDYGRDIEKQAYFEVLERPIPLRIAGELLSYRYDPDKNEFTCRWQEDGNTTAPTQVFLPARVYRDRSGISLHPEETPFSVEPASENTENVFIRIPPLKDPGERGLTIR